MSDTQRSDYNPPEEVGARRRLLEQRQMPPSLRGGDGPPPGLEGRVAKIEAHVENIRGALHDLRGDLKDIRGEVGTLKVDVATIRENVRHLPTKGFIVTAVILALSIATALLAVAPKLQQWVGTAPPTTTSTQK